jgi:hypothetical protein
MIELGALLGAMVITLGAIHTFGDEGDPLTVMFLTFIASPVLGAIWGAIVAGAIHVVAGFVSGLLGAN